MALITGVGLFVLSVLAAALRRLASEELAAWSPFIVRRLMAFAVARLPVNQRARFDEEWQAHINEVPGTVGKILEAANYWRAAHKMAATAGQRRDATRWLEAIKQLQATHHKQIMVANAIQFDPFLSSDKRIKPLLDELNSGLCQIEEMSDRLAADVSAYGAFRGNRVAYLFSWKKRRHIQKNFDQLSHQSQKASESCDQHLKLLAERRKVLANKETKEG